MKEDKKRWQYRFDNYKRAYFLLQEAIEEKQKKQLSPLEKEGTIQRFEYCTELAWKTIKDYMENKNVVFDQITPRAVLKEAFASKIVSNGEDWMEILDARNKMSHTYNFKVFEEIIDEIEEKYINCFSDLYETLASVYDEKE